MHKKYKHLDKEFSKEKMNIIFLDLDGVLTPFPARRRFSYNAKKLVPELAKKYHCPKLLEIEPYTVLDLYFDFDDISVGVLKKILYETGSYIVLSSEWRFYYTFEEIKALFKIIDLDEFLIDECDPKYHDRAQAIYYYLKGHNDEIDQFIIIDDFDMTNVYHKHMIVTGSKLMEQDYDRAIKVFEEEKIFV